MENMTASLAILFGILTIGLITPGPDFFLIVKNAMSGSKARAFATGFGIVGGLAVQVTAISLGLAAAPPSVLRVIQLIGAAVLAYIGIRALFSRSDTKQETKNTMPVTEVKKQAMAGFTEGFLCNVTNIKVFVFFASIFSQSVRPDSTWQWKLAVPVLIVVHGAIMWTLITAALLHPAVARQLTKVQGWLPRVFGAILLGFAIFVVWENLR